LFIIVLEEKLERESKLSHDNPLSFSFHIPWFPDVALLFQTLKIYVKIDIVCVAAHIRFRSENEDESA